MSWRKVSRLLFFSYRLQLVVLKPRNERPTFNPLSVAPTEKASILRPIEALPLVSALKLVLPQIFSMINLAAKIPSIETYTIMLAQKGPEYCERRLVEVCYGSWSCENEI